MLELGTTVGSYRVEAVLGRGGMGTVFRARHEDSGRIVALKILREDHSGSPEFAERLRREGRAQASLDHPHVVPVYDAGESEHGLYLAMGYVDGPRLVDEIRTRNLDVRRALALLAQVADALDAAHDAGLVHRDVKPHNVLVGAADHAYLADFGLTRLRDATALTATGVLAGTVAYLAPEVVRGEEAGPASDRYAFAAMAFECLTGTVVFPRSTEASVLFAHAGDPPPRAGTRRPELGDAVDDLLAQGLAKDPAARPASAGELVSGLRRALGRAGALDLPAPQPVGAAALAAGETADLVAPFPPTTTIRRRPRLRGLLAAGVAGAALVGGLWALVDATPQTRTPEPTGDRTDLRYVGADLRGPAPRTVDCRGTPAGPASPPCTVVQTALSGATLVVPRGGVIREWAVRGASGELTLVVLRERDGGAFQVSLTATETTGSADVQRFTAQLPVERGDRVGLQLRPGGAVGVRDGDPGAVIDRWMPPVAGLGRPADGTAGFGRDRELLLRVGIAPGATPSWETEVTGSAAARLPAGRERARRPVRFGGRTFSIRLVRTAGAHALDVFDGARRVARMPVSGMPPSAEVFRFETATWGPEQGGIDLSFVARGSARVVEYSYAVTPKGLERIR